MLGTRPLERRRRRAEGAPVWADEQRGERTLVPVVPAITSAVTSELPASCSSAYLIAGVMLREARGGMPAIPIR